MNSFHYTCKNFLTKHCNAIIIPFHYIKNCIIWLILLYSDCITFNQMLHYSIIINNNKQTKRKWEGGLRPRSWLELGNRPCRVGFVFVSNLNGLRIPLLEPNLFIKRVEKSWSVPIWFLNGLTHLTRLR